MKEVNDDVPVSGNTNRVIQATLAIPETAIRVIAAPPVTLTQRNVESVTGLPARTFLELIRSPGFPLRVAKLGKLRIVNRAAFVEWLERQQSDAIEAIQMNEAASEVVQEASNPITSILDCVRLQRTRELPNRRNRRRSR